MKLSGIGPLLAIVGGVSSIFLFMLKKRIGFEIQLQSPWREVMFVLGVVCAIVGVIFWIFSVIQVKRAYASHALETKEYIILAEILCMQPSLCSSSRRLRFLSTTYFC